MLPVIAAQRLPLISASEISDLHAYTETRILKFAV